MKFKETYSYNDVSLVPAYSELLSRSDADPSMHGYKLPIIGSCMDVLGYKIEMMLACENNIPFIAHRAFKDGKSQFEYFIKPNEEYTPIQISRLNKCVWFAVGSSMKYDQWITYLYSKGVRRFCVDMAHGDSKACIDTIKFIKEYDKTQKKNNSNGTALLGVDDYPVHIIAGNVATLDGFKRLQKAGADGIRVGIGSGSICSTPLETGMGVPILTNIIDIAKYKKNTWLIADGGANHIGDIAKAVYFGADFVMMGKMLASTDLADGKCYDKNGNIISEPIYPHELQDKLIDAAQKDIDEHNIVDEEHSGNNIPNRENIKLYELAKNENNKNLHKCLVNLVKYKEYHGMASRDARKNVLSYASVEGRSGLLVYSSSTEEFINDTFLRLQASLSYGGSHDWDEFRKRVGVVKRTISAIKAGKTHLDVLFDK